MNQYQARYQLKNKAKDCLQGNYPSIILMMVVYGGFQFTASMMQMLFLPMTLFGYFLSLAISFALSALLRIFEAGLSLIFLKLACRQPLDMSDLFYGFRNKTDQWLILSLVITAADFVCSLPGALYGIFGTQPGFSSAITALLLQLVGMFLFLLVSLMVSQSYFLMLDYPQLSAMDALKKSIRIMKGHKWRLFLLEISFLPLLLVSLFTCCIGFLWLIPYLRMTMTLFYLDLMSPASSGQ